MPNAPEQQARARIDAQLAACGWAVQDFRRADFSASRGIALREVRLTSGPCDYLLLVDRKAVGVVEAKKEGTKLSVIADQSTSYADNLPDYLAAELQTPPPFRYESTGIETFFRDERDPFPRSRRVFTFHRPETLGDWAAESDTLRGRLARMPELHPLNTTGMRDCQIEAVEGLEGSFALAHPRALIHMATGAGKTFTACAFIYRLIKHAGAKRVLFLVDRSNLGEQARDEFARFRTPDTGRLFTELYNVQHLTSPHIDDVARVTICTIQRLYSILSDEELPEGADDLSAAELAQALGRTPSRDVVYNPAVPIDAAAIPQVEYESAQRQLIAAACAPFDKPALRETLENLKRETEQAIDIFTLDEVASQGFDAAAKEKAVGLVQSFRNYLASHQAEIDALQILYSRPYRARLTEAPFDQRGGLGKAHQIFGAELVSLLDELNEVLAA